MLPFTDIVRFADTAWVFDKNTYPILEGIESREMRESFILHHILSHHRKESEKMNTVLEQMDHGLPVNEKMILDGVIGAIITASQFGVNAGISPERMESALRKYMGEHQLNSQK